MKLYKYMLYEMGGAGRLTKWVADRLPTKPGEMTPAKKVELRWQEALAVLARDPVLHEEWRMQNLEELGIKVDGDAVVVGRKTKMRMTKDDAIKLAAGIVAAVDPRLDAFMKQLAVILES